jgi:hypothetical protein
MRAGPLSSPEVVDLLNHYFVPVFVSMEDYEDHGAAPAAEKAEYWRIYHTAHAAKMSVGSVHVYIVSPAGEPIATRHVAKAIEPGELKSLLEQVRHDLKTPRGEPLFKPSPQSVPPERARDDIALHLVARYAHQGGSWNEFPAENWLVLTPAQWKKLLPASEQNEVVGTSWEIDPAVSTSILTHVYPQTENNDLRKNRIDRQSLKATVVAVDDSIIRVRLDGQLRMKHSFYPGRDTEQFVDATILGYFDFERASHRIRAVRIATDPANYDGQAFGVAVDGPYP